MRMQMRHGSADGTAALINFTSKVVTNDFLIWKKNRTTFHFISYWIRLIKQQISSMFSSRTMLIFNKLQNSMKSLLISFNRK